MKETIQIAIDGPAGAGKSTVAKILAQQLKFIYIDTGAMYRALTYKILEEEIDITNKSLLIKITQNTIITFENGQGINNQRIYCNQKDVTELIRTPHVNQYVSKIASIPEIRSIMVDMQRKLSLTTNVIMDGRDIGTVVLPQAKYKFFLTASLQERAKRRCKEFNEKGFEISYQTVLNDIQKRDMLDMTREIAPLKPAKDAIFIDTSNLTLNEVVDKIYKIVMEGENNAL
ncbi:MAG: (d)CMP kinase [Peptococcales bacterium]